MYVGSNIITLAVLAYFTSKSMTLIFDPSRLSKVKSDGANLKPMGPAYKCSGQSNLISVVVFEVF